jgi:hypothetical protein
MRAKEFLKEAIKNIRIKTLLEGGNLRLPSGDEAGQIDLKVHDRKFIVPVLNNVLNNINNSFAKSTGTSLWLSELIKSRKFLSGSSLHFFDTDISDEQFVKIKPKVGDIDTQVDRDLKDQLTNWLDSVKGKTVGPAMLLGYELGNEQYSSLWQLNNPPIKVQIDLEFVEYDKGEPTAWSQFSHSSSWDDLSVGIKGVFHKYLMRAFTTNTLRQRYIMTKTGKIQAKPVTSTDVAFAVAGGKGGGMRQKYEPVIDPETKKQLTKDSIPVFKEIPTDQSNYVNDIDSMFEMIFGFPAKGNDAKKLWSFTGGIALANKYLDDGAKEKLANGFILTLYGPAAQGLYRNDPDRDRQEKQVALDYLMKNLGIDSSALSKEAEETADNYYAKYKVEKLNENDVVPTKRQGIMHLQKMNDLEFINFVRSLKTELQGKLSDVQINLKVDGLGARFGKDASGNPFFESSHSGPIFQGGMFSRHAEERGFNGEKLERARHYDNIFHVVTNSSFVEALPPDCKVVCEIMYNPLADVTETGIKFVTVTYDRRALGKLMTIVPFEVVVASTGKPHPKSDNIIEMLLKNSTSTIKFIDPKLIQQEEIDVNGVIDPVMSINDRMIAVLQSRRSADKEEKLQIRAFLQTVKDELADYLLTHPGIVGKDRMGKDIEGMVMYPKNFNTFKVTTPDFKSAMAAKKAEKAKQIAQNEPL